ncbi:MAG: general secretion pathway protein GspK [Candidatus Omnitrophica bacterium]|nr:general secretion pathway protein GspK [Candidatus Omnitrophota bacterium]
MITSKARGSVLMLSLWCMCLLTMFAAYLGYNVRQKLMLVKRIEERSKLRFAAEAGVKKAISIVKAQEQKTYNALNDDLSANDAFKDIMVGDCVVSICYEYKDDETGALALCYGIADEERKINVKTASPVVLERFFRITLESDYAQSQALAASIIDWQDEDSGMSIPLGSAEDSYYRNLRFPYEAKDSGMEILDELLLVKGIDNKTFFCIKDYLTVYGGGKININTASKNVLMALGLDEDIADKIILFRNGKDRIAATPDDNVFESNSSILPKLSQFSRLDNSQLTHLSRVVDEYIATASDNFMIRSVARLNNGKNTMTTICVVDRKGNVLHWQES